MGIISRFQKIVGGLGGAAQAPFGLVKDFATAPWRDEEEFDGFGHILVGRSKERLGQLFGNLFGPDEGIGALIGAIPQGVRDTGAGPIKGAGAGAVTGGAVGSVVPVVGTAAGAVVGGVGGLIYGGIRGSQEVDEDLEKVYDKVVSKPLATLFTATTLAGEGQDVSQAYRIVKDENRSPGQALALGLSGTDILNRAEVARFVGTDGYEAISGVTDAFARLFIDPTVVAGKGATAGRLAQITKPIKTIEDINAATTGPRWEKFVDATEGKTAAEIRSRFFSEDSHGAVISTILAEAPDREAKALATRALMGDIGALMPLRAKSRALSNQIERHLGELTEKLPKERFDTIAAEVDELYSQAERTQRLDSYVGGLIREAPRATVAGEIRESVVRSDFYQKHWLAAPVRVTFNMKPKRLIDLHDQSGDIQLARMLRKSELDLPSQDDLRSRYMAAPTEADRQAVILESEARAVESIALNAGMTTDELALVMAEANNGRKQAIQVLKGRVYDGEGRSLLKLHDTDGVMTEVPLFISQNANVLPMVDLDEVKKAAKDYGEFRRRFGQAAQVPVEMMDKFYRAWKPAVLLRFGWPQRIILDEQLRIMAKIGALTQMKNLGTTLVNYATDAHHNVTKLDRGKRMVKVLDYEIESVFGAPGDADNMYRALASSRASFENLTGLDEHRALRQMRENTGEWRSLSPEMPDYGPAWEHAVNLQIAGDAMGKMLLRGKTVEEVAQWLRGHPEGIKYASRNKIRRRNVTQWARDAKSQVDAYVPTEELRRKALRGKVRTDDLVAAVPDPTKRPIVHGEILAQAMGNSKIGEMLNNLVEKGYETLGTKPSDVLSRNRFMDHMYQAEARRLVTLLDDQLPDGQFITAEGLRKIEQQSRQYALAETKKLLYDLAESSELSEMLRFFSPFYNAWQEVMTRWTGLAMENPAFVARMRLIWRSPERAGLITDEDGNEIDEKGHAIGPDGTDLGEATTEDRYLTFRLPEWVKDVPGLRTQGDIRFSKKSLNVALQGGPGFGPPVQILVNEVIKSRPNLEESVKLILPFGTTQESAELAMPTALKRLSARMQGEEDRVFFNTQMRIYYDKLVDYNLGKREDKPTWEEANREAKALYSLRFFASYTMPSQPSFTSPYQIYIDAYRRLKEADPLTADEKFLEQYGPEYFPLTQSLSKSMDGVPPTIEGHAARKKYKDLVEKYPELGGLIIGTEGAGEFTRSVYDAQLQNQLKQGSGKKQRERPDFEEASSSPNVRLGWMEFRKSMDLIDAARVQRGLPNLNVKGARDLALMKQAIVQKLEEKYPEWAVEFGKVDRNADKRKLEGLREIAADQRLAGRPEIQMLQTYLKVRDLVSLQLASRESTTITSVANQDLAAFWDTATAAMVEKNLAFGDLYYRYLERDLPTAADRPAA